MHFGPGSQGVVTRETQAGIKFHSEYLHLFKASNGFYWLFKSHLFNWSQDSFSIDAFYWVCLVLDDDDVFFALIMWLNDPGTQTDIFLMFLIGKKFFIALKYEINNPLSIYKDMKNWFNHPKLARHIVWGYFINFITCLNFLNLIFLF